LSTGDLVGALPQKGSFHLLHIDHLQ
jgi:hypothetical protein